jgi:hypothetical protein
MKAYVLAVQAWTLLWLFQSQGRVLAKAPPRSAPLVQRTEPLSPFLWTRIGRGGGAATPSRSTILPSPRFGMSRYDRFLQNVFTHADSNSDGRMTLSETYEWVLRLYVQINRQAPINPPTMAQVERLVAVMDKNQDASIGQEEFRALANLFVQRAAVRVAANKILTLFAAPLLAEALLQWIKHQAWLYDQVVVPYVRDAWIPTVTNPILGRTVLIVALVSTLGGMVMGWVNDVLDWQVTRGEAHEAAHEMENRKKGQ